MQLGLPHLQIAVTKEFMAIFRQVKQDMFHQNWDTGYRTTLPIKPLASPALKNYGAAMTEAK
jgi:hypothetical protein